ncbi:hypothetical protein K439DRAFT_1632518 [Ramaria rubella]|nr:hypothetical protein K439DRAFT_1632518 [Ramaria rubella]
MDEDNNAEDSLSSVGEKTEDGETEEEEEEDEEEEGERGEEEEDDNKEDSKKLPEKQVTGDDDRTDTQIHSKAVTSADDTPPLILSRTLVDLPNDVIQPDLGNIRDNNSEDVRNRVVNDLAKQRARQQSKHNSKRNIQRVGRPKGSKAKQDTRVKMDKNGVWE